MIVSVLPDAGRSHKLAVFYEANSGTVLPAVIINSLKLTM